MSHRCSSVPTPSEVSGAPSNALVCFVFPLSNALVCFVFPLLSSIFRLDCSAWRGHCGWQRIACGAGIVLTARHTRGSHMAQLRHGIEHVVSQMGNAFTTLDRCGFVGVRAFQQSERIAVWGGKNYSTIGRIRLDTSLTPVRSRWPAASAAACRRGRRSPGGERQSVRVPQSSACACAASKAR